MNRFDLCITYLRYIDNSHLFESGVTLLVKLLESPAISLYLSEISPLLK